MALDLELSWTLARAGGLVAALHKEHPIAQFGIIDRPPGNPRDYTGQGTLHDNTLAVDFAGNEAEHSNPSIYLNQTMNKLLCQGVGKSDYLAGKLTIADNLLHLHC
jgi:hypothetical protein